MENKNQPAFGSQYSEAEGFQGLTKREYFAAMAMQGLLASNAEIEVGDNGFKRAMSSVELANEAIHKADIVLSRLSQPSNQK
jgi:hypothetical protein